MNARRPGVSLLKVLVPAVCACALLFGIVGTNIYFRPVCVISIDVNPSVELSVNCFDKVIAADGKNEDGERLVKETDVKYMSYTKAVAAILQSEGMADQIAQGDAEIAVVSLKGGSNEEMLQSIKQCAGNGASCCTAEYSEVAAAHECGLSYGKYRAYLEAKAADPSLTPDDVKGLTMREIHELCGHESGSNGGGNGSGNCNGGGGYGNGGGHENNETSDNCGEQSGGHHGNGHHGGRE